MGDSVSRPRIFREGLPQGAVLSKVMFVIYLNDLLGRFSGDSFVSAYADDLAIACSNKSREQAQMDKQRKVDLVRDWNRKWRLTLAAAKYQTTLFTTAKHERSWKPTLLLNGLVLETRYARSEVRPRICYSQACIGDVEKGRVAQQHPASSGRSRLGVVCRFNADHIHGHPAKCPAVCFPSIVPLAIEDDKRETGKSAESCS